MTHDYELIGRSHAIVHVTEPEDLFEIARQTRSVIATYPSAFAKRAVIAEGPHYWYWLGIAGSWHPEQLPASNAPEALMLSNIHTSAAANVDRHGWIYVAIASITLFGLIAGPTLWKHFFG